MNVMLSLGMLVKSDSLVTKSLGPLKYRKMALLTYSNYSPQNPIPGKFLKPPGMCWIFLRGFFLTPTIGIFTLHLVDFHGKCR